MCWIGYHPKKSLSKEDIPVIKVMYDNLVSVYLGKQYEFNVVNSTSLDPPVLISSMCNPKQRYGIHCGFHSYSNASIVKIIRACKRTFISVYSEQGHLLDKLEGAFLLAYDCLIPKGSYFYVNENGEYVSDKIIILKPCTE